jgi:TolB-like protein
MIRKIFLIIIALILINGSPIFAKNMTILVHPFKNTGDTKFSWVSAGMTDTVISDLNRVKSVVVIADIDRKKALDEISLGQTGMMNDETIAKVGKMTGANVIFTGSYLVAGDKVRVNARLLSVETGKTERSIKIDGTLDKIFDLQDKIVIALIEESSTITFKDVKPLVFDKEDKKKIEESYKPKGNAYEWYAKGLELQYTNPKAALVNFKKAVTIDGDYTDALISAGYTSGVTLNLFDESLGYLGKADLVFKARKETEFRGYGDLMYTIAIIYWSKGQLDVSYDYYYKAKVVYDSLGLQNTFVYAGLIMGIGLIYMDRGQYDLALEYYEKSRIAHESINQKESVGYASLMSNIGIIHYYKKNLDLALEYYMRDEEIEKRIGLQNTANYARLMSNIGIIYRDRDKLDEALDYFEKSKVVYDSLGLQGTRGYGDLMYNFAYIYERQGKTDKAGDYYRKSFQSYDASGYVGEWLDRAKANAEKYGK